MRSGGDTTLATLDGLLKRTYSDDVIQDLQNQETETWKRLPKSSRKPNGEGFFGPTLVAGNQRGQGSQNENEALRTPQTQVVDQWQIEPTVFSHTIRHSGLALEMAKGDAASFADTATFQMDHGYRDSAKELNAQVYRQGLGRIAQAEGALVAGTVLAFDNGVPTHFKVGMFVDAFNGAGVKQIDSIEIDDIDIAAETITLASAQSCDDNSWIYRENTNDSAPAVGKELAGKPLIADDGTLQANFEDIPRTGAGQVPNWRGLTMTLTGQNVSNDLLQRAVFRMKTLSGTKVKKVYSNTQQFRRYLDLTIPAVRFKKGESYDTGYEEVPTWNGMEWVIDTDCGFGDIYLEDDGWCTKYEVRGLRADDTDGKIIKWDSGFDGFVSFIKGYVNTGTENPRKGIRMTALNTPAF